ncbi:hypothetical protein C468_01855 [Halorubrum kocurii JCM 14978]|uniref:Uncharacterized protein n=1 Tax=Halorubrum kocurii JCM 14978 TaxID=1230456 RepID=M0PGQ6_9EURY|nr:hypothetical protein C468_01855 [Halorubrum kocurii JCM 14978]
MHDEHVVEGDRDRKRFEVLAVAVAEPVRILIAAHDLLLVVSADADETRILTDKIDNTRTVWSLSYEITDEHDKIVVR